MTGYKPVAIPKASFAFCRFSLAALIWLSFFLHSEIILASVFTILLFSAVLKIRRAPMILFYNLTFNKFHKSEEILVNEKAMFFAHTAGTLLAGFCLAAVLLSPNEFVWYFVLGFAVIKSISALGFCPAARLYECVFNGNCCVTKEKE